MHSSIKTVTFSGVFASEIDVQVQVFSGLPAFTIVGLPDKSVAESKERIRASLASIGIAFPAKRVTVNLAPADRQKEGSHYDLPIALALLCAIGVIPGDDLSNFVAIGELALSGKISKVYGTLPAAIFAKSCSMGLICPACCAQEASWAGDNKILAADDLLSIINHLTGNQMLPTIEKTISANFDNSTGCLSDVKGQSVVKRALEIAACGGHNMLMVGPPGVGKSLLAARLPGILPRLTSEESLEVTMIHSIAGILPECGLVVDRPYRQPHHSASIPAIVGGGMRACPGEISLAHRGVLFLDELPEFPRGVLEALRQPLESGEITIARANHHVNYPAQIQLIAAMNPCKCGYLGIASKECRSAPRCGEEYMRKISGPIIDRIDIFVDVPEVQVSDFNQNKQDIETSACVRERVIKSRQIQLDRYKKLGCTCNAEADGQLLESFLNNKGKNLLQKYVEKAHISARGYYRILRLGRTLADMENSDFINESQIAEALAYRRII